MTRNELEEKYTPAIKDILGVQWFEIFIRKKTSSIITVDGMLNAAQLKALSEILEKIDKEKTI